METLTYDQPRNGYIAEDGTVTSWPELADGSHLVVTWDGSYIERQIKIANGKSNKARGSSSAWRTTSSNSDLQGADLCRSTRTATSMSKPSTGPTDAQGNQTWWSIGTIQANWVIEGEI